MEEGQVLFLPQTGQTKAGQEPFGLKSNSLHNNSAITSDNGKVKSKNLLFFCPVSSGLSVANRVSSDLIEALIARLNKNSLHDDFTINLDKHDEQQKAFLFFLSCPPDLSVASRVFSAPPLFTLSTHFLPSTKQSMVSLGPMC